MKKKLHVKKYIVLILASIHISVLYTAAEKGALMGIHSSLTPRQVAIAALQPYLPITTITNLVMKYYAPLWHSQTANTIPGPITLVPQEESIAFSLKPNNISLFSPETGTLIHSFNLEPENKMSLPSTIDFSQDGKLMAINLENNSIITIADILKCNIVHNLRSNDPISQMKFLKPDRLIASNRYNNAIKLWNTKTGNWISQISNHPHNSFTTAPDGLLLATNTGNLVTIWTTENDTFDYTHTIKNKRFSFSCMAFSPDSMQLAIGSWTRETMIGRWRYKIYILDLNTGTLIHKLAQYTKEEFDGITSIAYSSTNVLATGTKNGTILLWNPYKGKLLRKLEYHQAPVRSLFFSPAGTHLVSNSDNSTMVISEVPETKKEEKKDNRCLIS